METISQTRIQVKVLSILGSKLNQKADCFTPVKFKINANLEETEHGIDTVSLTFSFIIITDPKVVKYHVEGRVNMQGKKDQITKTLAPHATTKVPMVLYEVYQQVYASVFVLSKMIDAPSPSPELLSLRQTISPQRLEEETEIQAEEVEEVQTDASPNTEEEIGESSEADEASSEDEIEASSEDEIEASSEDENQGRSEDKAQKSSH